MARIRSVKPSLRTSRVVAQWKFEMRYFWVLLWGYLDDKGRGLDVPKTIAGDCFPYDDSITAKTVDRWLTVMAVTKVEPDRDPPVCRYEVADSRYVHSVYWDEHQRPNRAAPSRHPPCPLHEGLTEPDMELDSEPLTESFSESPGAGIRKLTEGEFEGAAREPLTEPPGASSLGPEPPPKCPKHLNNPNPPKCGGCLAAREAREDWRAEKRRRLDSAPRCPIHPTELAANCPSCRSERLAGSEPP